ncbi:hypothetical protein PM082_023369 [Marasmius tenuissimus]|nr:hypothetical protein PM082_023369 [Marasmius tenuissimus]
MPGFLEIDFQLKILRTLKIKSHNLVGQKISAQQSSHDSNVLPWCPNMQLRGSNKSRKGTGPIVLYNP